MRTGRLSEEMKVHKVRGEADSRRDRDVYSASLRHS